MQAPAIYKILKEITPEFYCNECNPGSIKIAAYIFKLEIPLDLQIKIATIFLNCEHTQNNLYSYLKCGELIRARICVEHSDLFEVKLIMSNFIEQEIYGNYNDIDLFKCVMSVLHIYKSNRNIFSETVIYKILNKLFTHMPYIKSSRRHRDGIKIILGISFLIKMSRTEDQRTSLTALEILGLFNPPNVQTALNICDLLQL